MERTDAPTGTLVPRDVLGVAIEAARRAGSELSGRFGRTPRGVRAKERRRRH